MHFLSFVLCCVIYKQAIYCTAADEAATATAATAAAATESEAHNKIYTFTFVFVQIFRLYFGQVSEQFA